ALLSIRHLVRRRLDALPSLRRDISQLPPRRRHVLLRLLLLRRRLLGRERQTLLRVLKILSSVLNVQRLSRLERRLHGLAHGAARLSRLSARTRKHVLDLLSALLGAHREGHIRSRQLNS